jgi:hypothetical protein
LGGLNTLAYFSFADLYPVKHPTTKHLTISQHDLSKTHHPKLKNEIIKWNIEMESTFKNGRRFTSDNSRPISGPLTLENLAAEVYTISESWHSFQRGRPTAFAHLSWYIVMPPKSSKGDCLRARDPRARGNGTGKGICRNGPFTLGQLTTGPGRALSY